MVCLAIILLVVNRVSTFASTTKEKLKAKGYHVSAQGVAVQTQKRFNREDYVDATQRCVVVSCLSVCPSSESATLQGISEGIRGVIVWQRKERRLETRRELWPSD